MSSRENTGMALGLLGVIIFSLTLPFTRIVVQEIHPLLNGLGRALFAAIPAAALLLWRRERWPSWRQVRGLCLVIAGVILGFPGVVGVGHADAAGVPRRVGQWPATAVRCAVRRVAVP
jgi:drug/metabolite transporter (DMT)-like permease